jgi:hypothetical protein
MLCPPPRYHMEGAEAWCSQPLHYNRSCELLQRTAQLAQQATELTQRAESFLSTSKGRRARRRRREEQQQALGGGTALVELERSVVQSYCK